MLFSLIDPEFAAGIMDMILEKTLEKFESSGINDEQIEKIISRIEDSNPFGNWNAKNIKVYIFNWLGYTLFWV